MENASQPPEIVLVAHGNLTRVKELLAQDPSLLNTLYAPWKETPLGAASHVGNREIAEYLLQQGAPLTIPTAAMLGRVEAVKSFLSADPQNAHAAGAHDISLLFHAAYSGDIHLADLLVEAGASTESAGEAIQAAVQSGKFEMVRWLLDHGADPNIPDFRGKKPLTIARENGQPAIADLLSKSGAVA